MKKNFEGNLKKKEKDFKKLLKKITILDFVSPEKSRSKKEEVEVEIVAPKH